MDAGMALILNNAHHTFYESEQIEYKGSIKDCLMVGNMLYSTTFHSK